MPAKQAVRFAHGDLGELGFQHRSRAGRRRYFRIEFLLLGTDETGDRAFQLLTAGAAFPALLEMIVNRLLIVRRQLRLNIQKQLLIGKM
jgi:hypothetical protein